MWAVNKIRHPPASNDETLIRLATTRHEGNEMKSRSVFLFAFTSALFRADALRIPSPFHIWKRPGSPPPPPPPQSSTRPSLPSAPAARFPLIPTRASLENFLEQLYDRSDTDRDGSISVDETYMLVLKLYIRINRKAPVPPPTRETVERLFRKADADRSGSISREEFESLARALAGRALVRVAAHRAVTLVGAPLLAEYLVRKLSGRSWLPALARTVVPRRCHDQVLPRVVNAAFGRTVLLVALISTLGNAVLRTINYALNSYLVDEEDGEKKEELLV